MLTKVMPTNPKATHEPQWAKKYAYREQETIPNPNCYNLTIKKYAAGYASSTQALW